MLIDSEYGKTSVQTHVLYSPPAGSKHWALKALNQHYYVDLNQYRCTLPRTVSSALEMSSATCEFAHPEWIASVPTLLMQSRLDQ